MSRADGTGRVVLLVCRAVVRLVSPLVPAARREEWVREWAAELEAHAGERRAQGDRPLAADLLRRTGGVLPHAWWLRRLEWGSLMQDVRFAIRVLRRQRSFTLAVVATLGIGIGGATTVFSIVNGVLLRSLPYGDADRLVWMFGRFQSSNAAAVSPPDFLDYRADQRVFSSFAGMMIAPEGVTVTGTGAPERLLALRTTAGYLETLGVGPALGREFAAADESLASPPVAIVSHRLWRERFGGAPDVLGRPLTIEHRSHTIVGVMPPGLELPLDPFIRLDGPIDVLLPLPFDAEEARVRRFHFLRVIGRLRHGVSLSEAQSHMDVIARRLEAAYPENATWRLRLLPLQERLVGQLRPVLLMLMGAVVLLLLIACSNVAGLLLARATTRQGEVAVRSALGASRGRLARQLLVEAGVLAAAGAAAGLLLAWWAVRALLPAAAGALPRVTPIAIDPEVVLFAMLAACGATVVCGLAPVLRLPRAVRLVPDEGARTTGSAARARLRGSLVAAQIALSLALLVAAGLLARSFARLQAVDVGFATDVLMAQISLPAQQYQSLDAVERFYTRLADELAALPGVEAAALATAPPLTGGNDTAVHREGRPPAGQADRQFAQIRWVQGAYFRALQIPLRQGRVFDDRRDHPSSPPVVVISERLADMLFPGEAAVGQRLIVDLRDPVAVEVAGVVGDTRVFGQASEVPPLLYMSARQFPTNWLHMIVRTAAGPGALAGPIRETVQALDPSLALARVESLRDRLRESVAQPRLRTGVVGLFAAIAVLLALTGVYGLMAFAVGQRTREIGIRLALGATREEVQRMVLRQAARFIAPGIVLGLLAAAAASQLMNSLLFEVPPSDPVVFIAAPLALTVAALAAAFVPARRAATIEPVRALRAE